MCRWTSVGANFLRGRIHCHTFVSYAFPCQTYPLLLSVAWQQNVMEYCWEHSISTVIPPTSASDVWWWPNSEYKHSEVVCFSTGDSDVKDKLCSGWPCTTVPPENEEWLDQPISVHLLVVVTMLKNKIL